MSDYIHTIDDVQQRTGLRKDYLERISALLSPLLLDLEFRKNGEKNRALYNTNGFYVFDRVKELNEAGLNRPQIVKKLEKELRNSDQTTGETRGNEQPNSSYTDIIALQQFLREAISEPYREVIQALKGQVAELREKQELLTDGRSVEEVRKEREMLKKYNEERARIIDDLIKNENRLWPSRKIRRDRLLELSALERQRQPSTK